MKYVFYEKIDLWTVRLVHKILNHYRSHFGSSLEARSSRLKAQNAVFPVPRGCLTKWSERSRRGDHSILFWCEVRTADRDLTEGPNERVELDCNTPTRHGNGHLQDAQEGSSCWGISGVRKPYQEEILWVRKPSSISQLMFLIKK